MGRSAKVAVYVFGIVALAVGAWFLNTDPTSTGDPPEGASEFTSSEGPLATAPDVVPDPSRSEEPAAVETPGVVDPDGVPPVPVSADLAVLKGRCVAAESGRPLSGCVVEFGGRASNSRAMEAHGPVSWSDPEPVVTDSDGCFEFSFDPPPPYQHALNIECEGRTPRTGRWRAFQPGQVEDLGDIALAVGYAVRGTVVDTTGEPVPKTSVRLNNLPLPIQSGSAANDTRTGYSDDNGRFEVSVPIPAGTWALSTGGRGVELIEPQAVTVEEGVGVPDLKVVVWRRPRLAGHAYDTEGRPLSRVTLVTWSSGQPGGAEARTNAEGRFTLYSSEKDPPPVQIVREDMAEERVASGPVFEWGTEDIRLTLERPSEGPGSRSPPLSLTVVEEGTGQPVEEFVLRCYPDGANSSTQRGLRLGGHHPKGKVEVDGIGRGVNHLQVFPRDPALVPSDLVRFEATSGGPAPMVLEIVRGVRLEVRVVSNSGDGIPGTRLELVRTVGRPLSVSENIDDPLSGRTTFSNRALPLALGSTVTDERGHAALHAPAGVDELAIRALGPGHVPKVFSDITVHEGAPPLVLEVSTGATIRGRLSGSAPEGYSEPFVQVESAERGWSALPDRGRVPLRGDGGFEVRSLPPGSYHVHLGVMVAFQHIGGGSSGRHPLLPFLATVDLDADEHVDLGDLDTSHLIAGTVQGRVLVDGEPPPSAHVALDVRQSEGSRTVNLRFGQFVTDPEGRFSASGLPPGECRVSVWVPRPEGGPMLTLYDRGSFQLRSGEFVSREFRILHQVLRVRLLEADGETPVTGVACTVSGERRYHAEAVTDQEGWLTLDPAPDEPVWIYLKDSERIGPVEMPENEKQAEIEVTRST